MVFERLKTLKEERANLQNYPRTWRPSTPRNADTIANVCEMDI
jgi:hypothetical protein